MVVPLSSGMSAARSKIYREYAVWRLFDVFMICGTLVLGICYVWARHLGHVGTFCDISDLVVHLPERILFRLNFALVGGLVAAVALPIHDVVSSRVETSGCWSPAAAACFQVLSGVGVILVGACGPEEIMWFHLFAAVLGFGGSGVAQIIYNVILFREEGAAPLAKRIHNVRMFISFLFITSAVLFGLGEANVLPEPAEHIFEWGMWFTLLGWYFTFRWDMSTLCLATITTNMPAAEALVTGNELPIYQHLPQV